MTAVTMPDGAVVDMPDQVTPELGQRLRAFNDAHGAAHAAGGGVMAALGGLAKGAAGGAEILGNTVVNAIPHAARGVEDLYRRVTGGDTNAPSNIPTLPLSQNAQETAGGIRKLFPDANPDNAAAAYEAIRSQVLGKPSETVADITHQVGQVAGDVANILPVAGAVGGIAKGVGAARAASAEAAANAPAAVRNLGMRTAQDSPIA